MNNLISRQLVIDDQTIHYQLERKAVKNLNLRIRNDGTIYVSADKLVPIDEIDNFVRKQSILLLQMHLRNLVNWQNISLSPKTM